MLKQQGRHELLLKIIMLVQHEFARNGRTCCMFEDAQKINGGNRDRTNRNGLTIGLQTSHQCIQSSRIIHHGPDRIVVLIEHQFLVESLKDL